jgi:hypothetical protein
VLDSNVFVADYWLRSPSFVLLRDFLRKTNATLVVPKIVFEEVVNHHKEDLKKLKSDVSATLREGSRLIRNFKVREDWIGTISRKEIEHPYQKFLSSELETLHARILDYSAIPHTEIVNRDLRRRKPFQQSGKGYRDTLLWETIVRKCIKKDTLTAFVTHNVRDFCGPDGNLHKDLQRDILAKTPNKNSLVLSKDLPTFTDTYIVPYLTSRKDFAVLVQNKKVDGLDLQNVSELHLDALIKALNESSSVMIEDPDIYEPEVDVIDVSGEFNVEQASEVSKKILLVVYEFQAVVFFVYFVPRSEYFTMSDEEQSKLAVLDADWNESVMRVESDQTVTFRCRLTFNSVTKEVESFEVENVERVDQ